jgi:beta-hydroxyacyl-ACP dehydratase FabZ
MYELKEGERLLSHEEVLKIIPHRYPFVMVDRVKINANEPLKAVGYKCVSSGEGFFQGHFPGAPVMPGVLTIEAMAQTACVLLLSKAEIKDSLAYFMGIDNVKFRQAIKPGDVLEMNVEVLKWSGKRGKIKGEVYIQGKLATEAEFMFYLVERPK